MNSEKEKEYINDNNQKASYNIVLQHIRTKKGRLFSKNFEMTNYYFEQRENEQNMLCNITKLSEHTN